MLRLELVLRLLYKHDFMKIYSAKSYFQRLLLFIIVISVLFSCVKDKEFPSVENIIKGGKWTIQIGSTAEEVYYQLQILGPEKKFNFQESRYFSYNVLALC